PAARWHRLHRRARHRPVPAQGHGGFDPVRQRAPASRQFRPFEAPKRGSLIMAYEDFKRDDFNGLSDEKFRALVRRFLAENHPPELRHPAKRLHWDEVGPWYMILSAAGWLAPAWPREHGGMGLNPGKQLIYVEEFEKF